MRNSPVNAAAGPYVNSLLYTLLLFLYKYRYTHWIEGSSPSVPGVPDCHRFSLTFSNFLKDHIPTFPLDTTAILTDYGRVNAKGIAS